MITTKALLLYRPGEACGLLESIFQPMVQVCGSFRLVVTFAKSIYFVPFIKGIKEAILIYGDPSEYVPLIGPHVDKSFEDIIEPCRFSTFSFAFDLFHSA